jgi:maltooligosyltrehalose trehalohydrolase
MAIKRKLPVGAEVIPNEGTHFRVWAPDQRLVILVIGLAGKECRFQMIAEDNGYHSYMVQEAQVNDRYAFHMEEKHNAFPDPASRFQPAGPHAASQIIDPSTFEWSDIAWQGIPKNNRVIYEMHIGTFTQEGTFLAAAKQLADLANLGVTVIEMMPVAEFDGDFGWGYDGVSFFAPYHGYGKPDDLRLFIDRAHALRIGVILDVVYNHCGASGCYLSKFAEGYFSNRYKSEWGDAFNFDDEGSSSVREFFVSNAGYWIDEFHFDGLRLDATQQIFDSSKRHVIADIVQQVRIAAGTRSTYIVAENEPQNSQILRSVEDGGFGLDSIWNDDFHHASAVALRGHSEAYFMDYKGSPQEFISAMKWGFLYQGQWYRWQDKKRGSASLDLAPSSLIHFLQNHDQIANSGLGKRIHQISSPGLFRALTALLLLGPATPMLFQGQEFCASSPFLYFAKHQPDLAAKVEAGRAEFLHQFPSLAASETQSYLPSPDHVTTFSRCKLDLAERTTHAEAYALHKDLLALRREDKVFSRPRNNGIDGAVLSSDAFVLRFFSLERQNDRLLLLNLGKDLSLTPIPEPLLAPHSGCDWQILWSSEHPRYGGCGTPRLATNDKWQLPGYSAIVLSPCMEGLHGT